MIKKYRTKNFIGASGSNRSSSERKHKAAIKLQNRKRTQKAKRDLSVLKRQKSVEKKHKAAIKLQNRKRTQKAKRDLSVLKRQKSVEKKRRSATKKLQSRIRGKKTRRNLSPIKAQRSAERLLEENRLNALFNIKNKTGNNFDTKLTIGNFRRVNLEGKKLVGKKLHNINLTYANLKFTNLTNAKFNNSNLLGANFKNAKLDKTLFINTNLKNANLSDILNSVNTDFTSADLTNAIITSSNFKNPNFSHAILINCQINSTTLDKPIFTHSKLNKINFSNSILYNFTFNDVYGNSLNNVNFTNVVFFNQKQFSSLLFTSCIFNYTKITKFNCMDVDFLTCQFNESSLNESLFLDSQFNECHFLNNNMQQSQFINVQFNKCNFNKSNLKISLFMDSQFDKCDFLNTNMQLSNFNNVKFNTCKLNTTIFSGGKFINCTFINCDLNSSIFSSFAHPHVTTITNMIFTENTELKNVAFNSVSLNNMNFNNIMLDGATFNGSDLTGSTFVGSSLRGSNFYWTDLNRTDFTDAIINEHTNFTDARGMDDNTRGLEARLNVGRAVDTHKAWANINMELLNDFFKENNVDITSISSDNQSIKDFLKVTLNKLLENTDETPRKKIELKQQLDRCFTGAINQFEHFSTPANNTTTKTVSEILTYSLEYINNQPDIFKNIYIISVISDIIAGHGAQGMSCPKGAIERLISYIASSAHTYIMTYDDNPTQEQSEKIAEYKKAIMIIENSDELRLDGFRKEWFDDHREPADAIPSKTINGKKIPPILAIPGGPNAFPEDITLDEKMENYNEFLRNKFGLHLNIFNQKQIDEYEDLIKNDKTNGVDAVKENLENYIYFLGGKRK